MPSFYPTETSNAGSDLRGSRQGAPRDDEAYDDYQPSSRASKPVKTGSREAPRDRRSKRRDTYDASDEDEEDLYRPARAPPVRKPGRKTSNGSPSISRPPIGESLDDDRDDEPARPRRRAPDAHGRGDGYGSRAASLERRPRRGEDGYDDPYARHRAPRNRSYDPPRPRHKDYGKDYDRDRKRGDDLERRQKDDRPKRRPYPDDDEESDYDPKPRRRAEKGRERDRRYGDGYDERGYRTDAPRRGKHEDSDRGYRTDRGKDSRRDRDKHRDRDPHARRKREDYDRRDKERDRHADDYRRSAGKTDKKQALKKIPGQAAKHWKTVEPVAKPVLGALAQKYLA